MIELEGGWFIDDIDHIDDPCEIHIKVSYKGDVRCLVCGNICSKHNIRERGWRERNVLSVLNSVRVSNSHGA